MSFRCSLIHAAVGHRGYESLLYGENNLCWTFEIISFIQQEKIRAELRNFQFRAIAHDMLIDDQNSTRSRSCRLIEAWLQQFAGDTPCRYSCCF